VARKGKKTRNRYGSGSYQQETLASGEERYWWIAPASKAGKRVKSPRVKTEEERDEWIADFTKTRGANAKRGTFGEVAEKWLASRAAAPPKLAQYRGVVENHLAPVFGEKPLKAITTDDINAYVSGKEAGTLPVLGKSRAKVGKSSIAMHVSMVRSIFEYALDQNLMTGRNPAARGRSTKLKLLKQEEKKPRALGRVEFADFWAAATDEERPHIGVLCLCGLRSQESATLRWNDWARSTLRVERARKAGGRIVGEPKSQHSSRSIPTSRQVDELLKGHKARQKAAGVSVAPSALMFPASNGGVLDPANYRRTLTAVSKRARMDEPVRPHWLRHTFAQNQINAGTNIALLSRLMGHRDAVITLREYIHFMDRDLPEVAEVPLDPKEARRLAKEANRRAQQQRDDPS